MAQQMEAARVYAQTNNVSVKACPVSSASLNMTDDGLIGSACKPIVSASSAGGNAIWPAWVWFIEDSSGQIVEVWQRSSAVPSTVSVDVGKKPEISFFSNGQTTFGGLTVTVTSNQGGVAKAVTLAASGRVTN